jgi:hypothetical protein
VTQTVVDLILRHFAEEKLEEINNMFMHTMDTAFLSDDGKKIKAMMELLRSVAEMETLSENTWSYVGRFLVYYVGIASASNITYTEDSVRRDLDNMAEVIPTMTGYVKAVASNVFNKKTFDEVQDALLYSIVNTGIDGFILTMGVFTFGIMPTATLATRLVKLQYFKAFYPELLIPKFLQDSLEELKFISTLDRWDIMRTAGDRVPLLKFQTAERFGITDPEYFGFEYIEEITGNQLKKRKEFIEHKLSRLDKRLEEDGVSYLKRKELIEKTRIEMNEYKYKVKKGKTKIVLEKLRERETFLQKVPRETQGFFEGAQLGRNLNIGFLVFSLFSAGFSEVIRDETVKKLKSSMTILVVNDIKMLNSVLNTMEVWQRKM